MPRSLLTAYYTGSYFAKVAAPVQLAVLASGCLAPHIAPPSDTPVKIPPQLPAPVPAAPKDGATLFVERALSILGQPYHDGGAGRIDSPDRAHYRPDSLGARCLNFPP